MLDTERQKAMMDLGITIWNKLDKQTPAHAKYCGRPGPYGNPFEIGPDGDRDDVCIKFDAWLDTGESFGCSRATEAKRQWILAHVHELAHEDLECWCWPKRCHCESLAKRANK